MPYAPRIPSETWEQHKHDIVAVYRSSSLQETMSYMGEKYGFRPRLAKWGISKYHPGRDWIGVASRIRKRAGAGKKSEVMIRRRKYTTPEVEKEIARHVSSREQWSTSGDIVLPDYITVSTPQTESVGVSREQLLRNLPWCLLSRGIQSPWNHFPTYDAHEYEDQSLESMKFLAELGASVDSRDPELATPLQRACRQGLYKSCCFLIDHGASIDANATDHMGTPLQEALKREDVKIANLLLEHGADVNAPPAEVSGFTALQAASVDSMLDMAVRLLEFGADVAGPAAKGGNTAINGAAERGYGDMVQLLLNAYQIREIDLEPVCRQAAGYAEKKGHPELAEWLRGYSPP
ncbi:ankyrin repeat-containing domain protein [Aspergillus pseudoustus]|uniref:Ankyrin repeat-containing domain protein n=1 Tax=Aspergillus pseudoustus TaxID=1810923 RepID=A0ABR4K5A8_9EURO